MQQILKKDQEILLTIKRLGINGEGIGYYKRLAVFVPGLLPPEEAIVRITDVTNNYAKGEVVRIKIKAKKRVKPFCEHFGECGGCQIQHIAYDEQLSLKEEMLIQTLERFAGLDRTKYKINDMIGMKNPKYYRHKSQMPVRNSKYGLTTGLYKLNSNELVPITHCPIHAENINLITQPIIEILDKYEIFAFDSSTMRGLLRNIVIRESHQNGEIQVTLVITIYNRALQDVAREIIKIPNVVSVGISKNKDAKNVEVFGEEVEILVGKNSITEGIGDIRYDLKPKAFYQLNPSQAIKLYKHIKSHLDFEKDRIIIDAYCGAGAISMYLAPFVEKVYGIDVSEESIYSALHNKKANKFENTSFFKGEVANILPRIYDNKITPDVIVFDPPRSGIDDKTLDLLNRKPVSKIIYVSCNPSTLAKNIKQLSSKYNVGSITPFDMFPHTSHIETVVVLTKK
ncbi:23S rRNA (uracil(1939)-C(5))-methyltransferase RlmD [Candidatus Izimaplasma bacterium HR1]|uniref:23S rRNA (uracil(1939)-C(5))-methyltransferase RlmD n=1 Tax=Candidatus Izimoplasma sp. HR1 TaxID=1541959 RepID=UPI000697D981